MKEGLLISEPVNIPLDLSGARSQLEYYKRKLNWIVMLMHKLGSKGVKAFDDTDKKSAKMNDLTSQLRHYLFMLEGDLERRVRIQSQPMPPPNSISVRCCEYVNKAIDTWALIDSKIKKLPRTKYLGHGFSSISPKPETRPESSDSAEASETAESSAGSSSSK